MDWSKVSLPLPLASETSFCPCCNEGPCPPRFKAWRAGREALGPPGRGSLKPDCLGLFFYFLIYLTEGEGAQAGEEGEGEGEGEARLSTEKGAQCGT